MVASLVPPSTVGFVPPHSYLWHVMHNTPIMMQRLEAVNGQRAIHTTPVPAWVELGGKRVFKVGIDLGNNGPKAAMFDPRGNIVVTHIQAVVRSIQDLAAGELGDTYEELLLSPPPLSPASEQQETEPPGADTTIPLLPATTGSLEPDPRSERQDISLGKEWIGMHAIKKDGQSLPKGTTRERFSDPRYARFLLYVIATLFKKAGYEQGDYDILLTPGMPNEEMKETGNGSQLDPETQQAMSAALCANKQWRIRLTDQHGRPTQYNLKIADLAPGPQSYAGFYAWQYRPDGQAAQTMIEEIVLEDLGANDLHELTISLDFQEKPLAGTQEKRQTAEVKMATRERKGDGIILAIMQPFARKLKNTYGLNELDDAIAQQAFFRGSITVGGFRENLDALVQATRGEQGASVITNVFKGPAKPRSFYLISGGGNVLLRTEILEKLTSMKRSPRSYLLLGAQHASTLNAVGLLAILDQICRYGRS